MPFTYEQGIQEVLSEILRDMPIEKRLEGVHVEELLHGLSEQTRQELLRRLQADNPDSSKPESL